MNLRSTTWLFALLLGLLWLFGLMVAYKKTAVDASFLVPSLQNPDAVVDSVIIERRIKDKQPEEFRLTKETNKDKEGDVWMLSLPAVKKSVKLDTFKVDQIIRQIKDARRSDEFAVTDDLARFKLDRPATTVILKGKAGKRPEEWKFYIGNESRDQTLMYVNSSDRPNKVYAILKSNIESVLFKDPNQLRSKRIFEFLDTAAQTIDINEGKTELDLKKGDDAIWRFEKPAYGVADFEGPPAPKDLPPNAKAPEGGVKGLLAQIGTIRVDSDDDFVPLSNDSLDTYGLDEGKESMRIAVGTLKTKGDKKELVKETLVIGKNVDAKGQVYGRLVGDEGVFKLNAKLLEPIKSTVLNPGALRSLDVANVDPKKVDAVMIEQKGDKVALYHPDGKPWDLQVGAGKIEKANNQAVDALVEAVQGKREIVKFFDGDEFKKLDAEMKSPSAVVAIYVGGLEEPKKETDAKDKDAAKDKKDDKKDTSPQLKKDAKPAVTLTFGAADKDTVHVQRVMADGTASRFALPKSVLDKIIPGDVKLAYLETDLPPLGADDVDGVTIARGKDTIEIEKGWGEKSNRWFFKEGQEPPGKNPTDAAMTNKVVTSLSVLSAKRWLHKLDAKEDLDKYGLNKPSIEVTLRVRKERPAAVASFIGTLASAAPWRSLLGEATLLANRFAGPSENVVLKVGKEATEDKDKPAVYAQRSDKDLLFLLPADVVHTLRDTDLHDRASVFHAEPIVSAALVGLEAAGAANVSLAASPLATNIVQRFDAAKVTGVKLAVRTPDELRSFAFQRDPGGKDWRDQSGLQEFHLDSQKVSKFVESLASLQASRWVNLTGGTKGEQKLAAKDATLRVEVILEGGRTVTLTVGALFEGAGYYAQTSAMPDGVFLLAPGQVQPLLHGPGHFAKERLAGF